MDGGETMMTKGKLLAPTIAGIETSKKQVGTFGSHQLLVTGRTPVALVVKEWPNGQVLPGQLQMRALAKQSLLLELTTLVSS